MLHFRFESDLPIFECSAQRVARQGKTVMAVHQTVQHGIGHGGVSYPRMPMAYRQLAGDDGGGVRSMIVIYQRGHRQHHLSSRPPATMRVGS